MPSDTSIDQPLQPETEATTAVIPQAVPPQPPSAPAERTQRITAEILMALPQGDLRDNAIAQLARIEVARQNYSYYRQLGRDFAMCGEFDDLNRKSPEQAVALAVAKMEVGDGWGMSPSDAVRYVYFANGRPSVENQIIADRLQQAGFDWDIEWMEETVTHKGKPWKKCIGCTLWLKRWNGQRYEPMLDRNQKPVSVSFTEADADHAMIWEKGKQVPLSEKWNFKSWGRDMYYWRCIGRVKKYHAPRVLKGAVSREEALEMIPVSQMPPEMLPKELQPPAPKPEAEAPPERTKLHDKIMAQAKNPDVRPEPEPESQLSFNQGAEE